MLPEFNQESIRFDQPRFKQSYCSPNRLSPGQGVLYKYLFAGGCTASCQQPTIMEECVATLNLRADYANALPYGRASDTLLYIIHASKYTYLS